MPGMDLTPEDQRAVFEFIQTHPLAAEMKVALINLQAALNAVTGSKRY